MIADEIAGTSARQSTNYRAHARTSDSGTNQRATTCADRASQQSIPFSGRPVASCKR